MLYLPASARDEIIIKPRWPYKQVAVSEEAYSRLQKAQDRLRQHGVRLALTRGYEYEGVLLKRLHQLARAVSARLFGLIYPHRKTECREIFSANGHNVGGDNVDVAIYHNEKFLTLLPNGVFTPARTITHIRKLHSSALSLVVDALESNGFVIHLNKTESMQIHCHVSPAP